MQDVSCLLGLGTLHDRPVESQCLRHLAATRVGCVRHNSPLHFNHTACQVFLLNVPKGPHCQPVNGGCLAQVNDSCATGTLSLNFIEASFATHISFYSYCLDIDAQTSTAMIS